ncbi:AAA domain-containing protein [Mesorhizobium sp. M1340]|uniref:AAA domain-containing protein n=1 Tax=Mesorhizobium sp. M1340 TaxID=2957087 RepID=UPI00333C702D
MAKRSTKKASGFTGGFSLSKSVLLRPDRKSGRPGLREGSDSSGRRILLKYWPREKGVDDQDLDEIWRSEIRQLHRLASAPHADEYIVRMLSNGVDESGFYIVLDAGETIPLQHLRENNASVILQTFRQVNSRALLWNNFSRLVRGVDILHSQGIVHRNIDPWCVLTTLSSTPDFRLTGFEWSMRVAVTALENKRKLPASIRQRPATSFAADWADLAFVFADLLEIPLQRLADMNIVPSAVVEHTAAAEIRLLRTMMGLLAVDRLDSEEILRHLSGISATLRDELASREMRYFSAMHLGDASRLTRKIREALDHGIEVSDIDDQISFIKADLGPNPIFLAHNREVGGEIEFLLCGDKLNYRMRPYKRRGSTEPESWAFAFVDDADSLPPLPMAIQWSTTVDASSLEFLTTQAAQNDFPKLRGKALSWEVVVNGMGKAAKLKSPTQLAIQALSLLLRLEMAFATTAIYPIRVLTRPENAAFGDRYRLEVSDEPDTERYKLAEALKLDAPAARLQKLLAPDGPNEDLRQSIEWALLDVGSLGTRGTVTKWRVETPPSPTTDGIFVLEGNYPPQVSGRAFLTPADTKANLVQLERRQKALRALAVHTELLQLLVDQRDHINDSQEPLNKLDPEFAGLDESKKLALEEIVSTIPFFMLQGPPGVGKTYLVTELVRRKLLAEPTSRILLSAQSNSAIDHLMDEVADLYKGDERPVLIRARAADDEKAGGPLEISTQATFLLKALAGSELCENEDGLTTRIRQMADVSINATGATRGIAASDRRAFESLLLRSANIVAATTNSPALETLIEERGFFDWTIIEEAAKASGTDLIQPLLLSYRRLMIGDHMQLPPFDLDRMKNMLADPSAVRNAILASKKLLARYLKDVAIDEFVDDEDGSLDDLAKTCADGLGFLTMFETFIEREYGRIERRPYIRRIARRLNEQHRMHPAIARIVSRSFYKDELVTFPAKEVEFLTSTPPVSIDPSLGIPDSPVVFVDLPYSRQAARGTDFGDSDRPFRVNRSEVRTCCKILSSLKVAGGLSKKPTLAILSPYAEQVKLLRSTLGAANIASLERDFRPEGGGEFFGTVDSFQGREADCVVVSLVRNNEHTNPVKALGFLGRSNRMNVLVSRAKHKLVIVGSLLFLDHVLGGIGTKSDPTLDFFRRLLMAIRDGEKRALSSSCSVPEVSVVDYAKFD